MKITIDNSDVLKLTFKGSVNIVREVTLPKEAIAPIARALKIFDNDLHHISSANKTL
ncbi:hypothetical protein GQ472_01525 [archaeon]|nr:hypothetical protein [archaeon]